MNDFIKINLAQNNVCDVSLAYTNYEMLKTRYEVGVIFLQHLNRSIPPHVFIHICIVTITLKGTYM